MATLNTKIRGMQINQAVAGAGLIKDANENLAVGAGNGIVVNANDVAILAGFVSGTANVADVIALDGNGVSVGVDETTIDDNGSGQLSVVDSAITEPKLAMNDSPSAGEVITWNALGYMEWTSKVATDAVMEADILFEDFSASCDDVETDFVLAQIPISNSVQVYLNGLLQQEGSAADYTLTSQTISFAVAPLTGDLLLVHYIQNN